MGTGTSVGPRSPGPRTSLFKAGRGAVCAVRGPEDMPTDPRSPLWSSGVPGSQAQHRVGPGWGPGGGVRFVSNSPALRGSVFCLEEKRVAFPLWQSKPEHDLRPQHAGPLQAEGNSTSFRRVVAGSPTSGLCAER